MCDYKHIDVRCEDDITVITFKDSKVLNTKLIDSISREIFQAQANSEKNRGFS